MVTIQFAGYLFTFHIDSAGRLIENAYTFAGNGYGHQTVDKVLLSNNVPGEVAVTADALNLYVGCVYAPTGAGRFLSYNNSDGHWHDALGNVIPGI